MKKKKKKVQGEVAGQSRLGKYPFLSRDVVALFRAARIACTGEYGPFEELSFGGLDRWVRICESENGFYLLRQRDCTFGFGRAGVGKRGGWNKNKIRTTYFSCPLILCIYKSHQKNVYPRFRSSQAPPSPNGPDPPLLSCTE